MAASAGTRRAAFVIERGDGQPIRVVGDEVTIKVSSWDTDGAFTVLEGRTRPQSGPPLHVHRNQDETWYILEGEYLFEVDGQQIRASAGDTVFASRGTKHTFQNIGATPGRMLATIVPGGLDIFFAELEKAAPDGAVPDLAKMIPLFEKHGLEFHGPPLSAR